MSNVLILSAGRRVELVERFKNAYQRLGISAKVVAADLSLTAPAMYFADVRYQIPRIGADGYFDAIIDICKKEKIALIVPTIDTELLPLSEKKEYIENQTGAKILLSDSRVVSICRDKNSTQKFFEENGFGVPRQIRDTDILDGNFSFPLFIKPKDGSSSINTFKVNNADELDFFRNYIKEPLIQEFIEGTEFSVDVFCDFDANPITIVPRVRMATRSGEISKGKITKDKEIIADIKRLLSVLRPIGHITVQCMKTAKGIKYIEINPRFGGGAPMSIDAGADSCEYLYRLLNGEKLEYNENYVDNALFVRFDNSIMLDENMRRIK